MRARVATGLIVVAALCVPALPAHAASPGCAFPKAVWTAKAPAKLGLDAKKLQDALDFAVQHSSETVLVVRHGCLAGSSKLDALTGGVTMDGWSVTKSVTALLVGRAVAMRKLDIAKPIGRYFPEADRAHKRITPRQLMWMSSGLRLTWLRDFNATELMPDRVKDALSLKFDHKPGTYWAYGQSPVVLLAETVTRAVKKDIQAFAQKELFAKLGIASGAWTWERDRAGHTQGWAHLHMLSSDWARIGHLILRNGNWNGRQLISRDYMRQFRTSAPTNHAYGFLTWLNGKDSFVMPSPNGYDSGRGWVMPNAPRDAIIPSGQDEQRIYVLPSLDMVIVRFGQKGSREADFRKSFWTSRSGEFDNGFMLRIKRAVTDRKLDLRDHYKPTGIVAPSLERDTWGGSAIYDPVGVAAGFGLGPEAPKGCTPAGCG